MTQSLVGTFTFCVQGWEDLEEYKMYICVCVISLWFSILIEKKKRGTIQFTFKIKVCHCVLRTPWTPFEAKETVYIVVHKCKWAQIFTMWKWNILEYNEINKCLQIRLEIAWTVILFLLSENIFWNFSLAEMRPMMCWQWQIGVRNCPFISSLESRFVVKHSIQFASCALHALHVGDAYSLVPKNCMIHPPYLKVCMTIWFGNSILHIMFLLNCQLHNWNVLHIYYWIHGIQGATNGFIY